MHILRPDAHVPQRPDETLLLLLEDVRYLDQPVWSLTIGGLNVTTLTVLDDGDAGTVGFAPTRYSIAEGADMSMVNQTFTVTRYGREAPSQLFTLRYTTMPGTAHEGDDFVGTQGTVTLADNQTLALFVVQILDDVLFEVRGARDDPASQLTPKCPCQFPDETFNVTLDDYRYLGTEDPDYSTRIDGALAAAVATVLDDGDAGVCAVDRVLHSG